MITNIKSRALILHGITSKYTPDKIHHTQYGNRNTIVNIGIELIMIENIIYCKFTFSSKINPQYKIKTIIVRKTEEFVIEYDNNKYILNWEPFFIAEGDIMSYWYMIEKIINP